MYCILFESDINVVKRWFQYLQVWYIAAEEKLVCPKLHRWWMKDFNFKPISSPVKYIFPSIFSTSMAWGWGLWWFEWKCPYRLIYLKDWSPVGGTVWERYGTFRMQSLARDSMSLGVGFESSYFSLTSSSLSRLPVGKKLGHPALYCHSLPLYLACHYGYLRPLELETQM